MKIEQIKINDLIPYPGNAKLHPDKQILRISGSIKEFGFKVPVLVDKDNGIIAGHGRVEAAKKLKMKEVPCVRMDDLTPAQCKALRIAENQLTMSSGWDYEMLGLELDGLKELDFDLDVLGFNDLDFMGIVPDFQPGTEDEQGRLDELQPKLVKCPHCEQIFDSRGHEQD